MGCIWEWEYNNNKCKNHNLLPFFWCQIQVPEVAISFCPMIGLGEGGGYHLPHCSRVSSNPTEQFFWTYRGLQGEERINEESLIPPIFLCWRTPEAAFAHGDSESHPFYGFVVSPHFYDASSTQILYSLLSLSVRYGKCLKSSSCPLPLWCALCRRVFIRILHALKMNNHKTPFTCALVATSPYVT